MTDYDAVIIGAGHNGLVCAGYLAKAGKRVLVVDGELNRVAAPAHGSSAPVSTSPTARNGSQFDQSIVKELDLKGNGLRLGQPKCTISLQPDSDHLIVDGDTISGAGVDSADQAAYRDFKKMVAASPSS